MGEARTEGEIEYVKTVEDQGEPVVVKTNASHSDVREWLARARVFWHAAGLSEDEARHPERLEHFGISTVEAMANGCVPVVIRRGGQPEIIEHAKSGFLCGSLEEMMSRTAELAADQKLWARMSSAARERAAAFGRAAFERRFQELAPFLWATGSQR